MTSPLQRDLHHESQLSPFENNHEPSKLALTPSDLVSYETLSLYHNKLTLKASHIDHELIAVYVTGMDLPIEAKSEWAVSTKPAQKEALSNMTCVSRSNVEPLDPA